MDALLLLFLLAYVLLHWLWAVPVWDRYLLPILPLAAVLFGRALSALWRVVGRRESPRWPLAVALLVASLTLIPVGLAARQGRYPLGGQPTADGGAALAALALEDAPYGTVLYDHWYSWHWNYQLFDGRVYVSWFPHADALVEDLAVFAGASSDRYIALPASPAGEPVARRLSERGYALEAVGDQPETASMTIYRILSREPAQ